MVMSNKDIIECAKESLSIERDAINNIIENFDGDVFCKFISIILNTKGKIMLSAVGKPGYIAHKTAATLSSTGTPSFYIHPTEASHGDLGMITENDTVVLLSSSGESKELTDIVAYCKRNGIIIVSLTRNAESFISKSSNLKIVLNNLKETNDVDSPTTSMIMFCSYMDAVITTLIKIRGFNKDNFKNFHPGGKIGASLLKVSDVMRDKNIPLVNINSSMKLALDEMIDKNIGCVGIIDNDDKLIGIITDGDLKRKINELGDIMSHSVSDIMTINPKHIKSDSLAVEAVSLMNSKNGYIQVLFVVDENMHVIGILHIQDLFKARVI